MAQYAITNTANVGKIYEAANGKRMKFQPGETKELSTKPPESAGWKVEINEEKKTDDTDSEEVNE